MLAHSDQGNGQPVVLLHGFPLTREMWKEQVRVLSQACRVIVPDLNGFGGSPLRPDDVSMGTYAADVAELLDELGIDDPVALAGFSMGGYAALAFLREYPSRVGALALVDTKASADTPEARQGRGAMAERVRNEGANVIADAMLPKLFSPSALDSMPDLAAEVHATMAAQSPEAIAQALEAMAARADSTPLLGEISVPTLVIAGALDEIITLQESRQMAATVPGARLVEIAGVGHLAPMEAPEVVTAALTDWTGRR